MRFLCILCVALSQSEYLAPLQRHALVSLQLLSLFSHSATQACFTLPNQYSPHHILHSTHASMSAEEAAFPPVLFTAAAGRVSLTCCVHQKAGANSNLKV
jgi:hypothetical protein